MFAKTTIRAATILALVLFTILLTKAHPATGIVVDRQNRIYFSDLETVWRLNPDGSLSTFRAGVRGRHVHELFMDNDGNVYGADVSYEPATQKWISAVWKMTPDGNLSWLQEPSDNPKPGMSLWIDAAGNMYSVDQNNHTRTRTLLLRRAPDGTVTTLAGGAYGHTDGKGAAAKFSSVGGMTFGPEGSLYLTDGNAVRKVTMGGSVTTVARNLDFTTSEDRERLFSGNYGSLAGLAVDANENVYVADAGRRRLLKANTDGKIEVVHRAEPPFFPNGVFVVHTGDVYVLEVGFTLPNITSGPRVRKISPDGKNVVLVTVDEKSGQSPNSFAVTAGVTAETFLQFIIRRPKTVFVATLVVVAALTAVIWRRHRRAQRP
jgi:sugar lactone lactonase YvrE